jgi:transposase-like protein
VSQSNSKNNQPKQYIAEFKAKVVLEVLSGTKSFSQACREYEISEQSLSNWKGLF